MKTHPEGLLRALFLVTFVLVSARLSRAQEVPTSRFLEILAQAKAKLNARAWSDAATFWEQVVRLNPVEGRFWNQLAVAHVNAKNYRQAITGLEKVQRLGEETGGMLSLVSPVFTPYQATKNRHFSR